MTTNGDPMTPSSDPTSWLHLMPHVPVAVRHTGHENHAVRIDDLGAFPPESLAYRRNRSLPVGFATQWRREPRED